MKTGTITVQRSEDLLIQLPDELGFECGEDVSIKCMDDGSICISHLVDVEVDLDDDVILALSLEAHKRNIKLNDLMVEILRDAMDNEEKYKITDKGRAWLAAREDDFFEDREDDFFEEGD